jgi:[ribosomal protein S18]-alanine N-acetyltransferase
MPVSVRYMKLSDIPAVLAIETQAFTSPWSEESLRSEVGAHGSVARVAVYRGNIAGFVMARTVLDEAQLLHIAVMQEYRRRGIARLLMEDLIDFLRSSGTVKIFLEVRISNIAAINLYRSLDFTGCGTRTCYYRNPAEDAKVMMLEI